MSTFKKILAWILVVISVLGILVCSIGVIGSWMVNEQLTTRILNLLTGAQVALSKVETSLTLASTQLHTANSAIATAREAATQLGDRIENNSPVLDTVISVLKDEVGPTVARIRDVFLEIEDRVQTVNSSIELLNNLPGIEIPTLNLEFQGIRDKVKAVEDAVQQLQQNILDFRAGIVKSLAPFREKIDAIAAFLVRIEEDVNTYLKQVRNLQVLLVGVKARVPAAIDSLTILISVILLWTVITQISLILLASLYLRTGRMVWDISDPQKTAEAAPLAPAS